MSYLLCFPYINYLNYKHENLGVVGTAIHYFVWIEARKARCLVVL